MSNDLIVTSLKGLESIIRYFCWDFHSTWNFEIVSKHFGHYQGQSSASYCCTIDIKFFSVSWRQKEANKATRTGKSMDLFSVLRVTTVLPSPGESQGKTEHGPVFQILIWNWLSRIWNWCLPCDFEKSLDLWEYLLEWSTSPYFEYMGC